MSHRARLAPVVATAAAMLMFAVTPRPASATLIIIPNASFQNPEQADNTFSDTGSTADAVPDWTFAGTGTGIVSAGVWDPTTVDYTLSGGNNVDVDGLGPSIGGQVGYIYLEQTATPQPLSGSLTTAAPIATIEDDTSYNLTVALGHAKGVVTGSVEIEFVVFGSVPIDSIIVPAASIPQDSFADFTVNLTTSEGYPFSGTELQARIVHNYGGAGSASLDIDNVRFDVTKIPEPAGASVAFMTLGALISATRRGRRRGRSND
jgi:hypothetical protein